MAEKIKWEDANFKWEKAPTDETKDRYTWDSVLEIIEEVTDVSTGGVDVTALEKLDKKKKKKLIRLIMHRNGIKIYDEEKDVKTIAHKIKDIELIAEEIKAKATLI